MANFLISVLPRAFLCLHLVGTLSCAAKDFKHVPTRNRAPDAPLSAPLSEQLLSAALSKQLLSAPLSLLFFHWCLLSEQLTLSFCGTAAPPAPPFPNPPGVSAVQGDPPPDGTRHRRLSADPSPSPPPSPPPRSPSNVPPSPRASPAPFALLAQPSPGSSEGGPGRLEQAASSGSPTGSVHGPLDRDIAHSSATAPTESAYSPSGETPRAPRGEASARVPGLALQRFGSPGTPWQPVFGSSWTVEKRPARRSSLLRDPPSEDDGEDLLLRVPSRSIRRETSPPRSSGGFAPETPSSLYASPSTSRDARPFAVPASAVPGLASMRPRGSESAGMRREASPTRVSATWPGRPLQQSVLGAGAGVSGASPVPPIEQPSPRAPASASSGETRPGPVFPPGSTLARPQQSQLSSAAGTASSAEPDDPGEGTSAGRRSGGNEAFPFSALAGGAAGGFAADELPSTSTSGAGGLGMLRQPGPSLSRRPLGPGGGPPGVEVVKRDVLEQLRRSRGGSSDPAWWHQQVLPWYMWFYPWAQEPSQEHYENCLPGMACWLAVFEVGGLLKTMWLPKEGVAFYRNIQRLRATNREAAFEKCRRRMLREMKAADRGRPYPAFHRWREQPHRPGVLPLSKTASRHVMWLRDKGQSFNAPEAVVDRLLSRESSDSSDDDFEPPMNQEWSRWREQDRNRP
ncbi:conserved hypothetical protein [Neospora caninum Liverpool]|uniref:Transmembrane protein n=1 Tax=Neospora caninum (strain Liverpool) TaxID=572307 RepID=F0VGD2_NEOCL|nr:conserved hypothetical protein [Neospora caninum Liverpool]CBZ52776.1 conserved hypothetical protein [Neospora caninum Liverpool]CEL66758.1 TPA: hypothetical protein BN1204_025640 [Neospora caninum Liverpool]|eukprot:XP_003882808.1 conserved hypothetical protein [Neospora caninum Liverpool]